MRIPVFSYLYEIFHLFIYLLYLFFNQMTAPMDEDELCDTK